MQTQKAQHYINLANGGELNLTQDGEISGLRAGDRIKYTDECFEKFRGKLATVIGFDKEGQVWTQPDGQTGCASTKRDYVNTHLEKIEEGI